MMTECRGSTAVMDRSCWYRRPRLIYFTVFMWISITGGRFTASFLEAESSWTAAATVVEEEGSTASSFSSPAPLDPGQIGTILAIMRLIMVFVGSVTGIWADKMEAKYPKRGRILLLGWSCTLGSLVFLFHGVHRYVGFHGQDENSSSSGGRSAFQSFFWFLLLRAVYAIVTSSVFPILDGICLEFLKNNTNDTPISKKNPNHRYDAVPDSTARLDGREEMGDDEEPTATTAAEAPVHEDVTDDYGKERLYGAISWAATNLLMGPVLDHYEGDFWALYPLSILVTVLLWGSIAVYLRGNRHCAPCDGSPPGPSKPDNSTVQSDSGDQESFHGDQESNGKPIVQDRPPSGTPSESSSNSGRLAYYLSILAVFCATSYTVAFLVCVTTLASGQAIVNDLIFLFFEVLGSSHTLLSVTVVLTVVFEIPIFQVAPKLLRRFGCDGLLIIASLAYALRVLGYTLVPQDQPVWVLWLEPLHGITYACSQTAAVSFVATKIIFGSSNSSSNNNNNSNGEDENSDERSGNEDKRKSSSSNNDGTEATGQGFLQFFLGIGSVLGLEFGGVLQDTLGARTMYRLSTLVVLMGCAIFAAALVRPRLRPSAGHRAISQLEDALASTGDTMEETRKELGAMEMTATNEASPEECRTIA